MKEVSKKVNMQAFVGVEFDCEFYDRWHEEWTHLTSNKSIHPSRWCKYRPRMNKAQVLDDWSWVPDGLVWEVHVLEGFVSPVSSSQLKQLRLEHKCSFEWAKCIGIELEYAEWGRERGMEVIEL